MNPLYQKCYNNLARQAASARLKRGKKLNSYVWARTHPTDKEKVELGYYYALRYTTEDSPRYGEPIAPRLRPFLPIVTLDPEGCTIVPRYGVRREEVDPQAYAEHPTLVVPEYGLMRRTDTTLNNLLAHFIQPTIRNQSPSDRRFPGLTWGFPARYYVKDSDETSIRAIGPVRYDALMGTLSALEPQPEKVVDKELRASINKRLRKAYVQLKALTRFEVVIPTADITALLQSDLEANWWEPQPLLDALDQLDATNREQIVEVYARIGAVISPIWVKQYATNNPANFARYYVDRIADETRGMMDDRIARRVRAALQNAYGVVRYET